MKKYFCFLEQFRIIVFTQTKEEVNTIDSEQNEVQEEEIMVQKIQSKIDMSNKIEEARIMLA